MKRVYAGILASVLAGASGVQAETMPPSAGLPPPPPSSMGPGMMPPSGQGMLPAAMPANPSGASQVAPDFEERAHAFMNMVKARLDQAARGEGLTKTQKQARILQEALLLLGQLQLYIATYGIHDTFTTIREINAFQDVVAEHMGEHLSE
jgi:hypothetical protein